MRQVKTLIIFCIILGLKSCSLFRDDCEDTEAPEINFGVKAGGTVKFMSWEGTDITGQFEGQILTITFYKDHCDGTSRGPFDYTYTIDKYGELWRNEAGYWSFKMNNKRDRIRTRFYFKGVSLAAPAYDDYEAMKPYDGAIVHHNYRITIDLKSDNATVQDALVERLN